jgi:hypothetical protein
VDGKVVSVEGDDGAEDALALWVWALRGKSTRLFVDPMRGEVCEAWRGGGRR